MKVSRNFFWMTLIAILFVFAFILLFLGRQQEEPANEGTNGKVYLYNWLPKEKYYECDVKNLEQYISECDLIVEVDRIEIVYECSHNTETKVTRTFYAKEAEKGGIPPGAVFYDEIFLEENNVVPGKTKAVYEGEYWLLLKHDFLSLHDNNRFYIDRSEGYVYNYFLYGINIRKFFKSP